MSNIYEKSQNTEGMQHFPEQTFPIKETVIDPDAIGKTYQPTY